LYTCTVSKYKKYIEVVEYHTYLVHVTCIIHTRYESKPGESIRWSNFLDIQYDTDLTGAAIHTIDRCSMMAWLENPASYT
jgi:hypothetical protein